MIAEYLDAVNSAFGAVVSRLLHIAMPLAVCAGLGALAAALAFTLRRDDSWLTRLDVSRGRGVVAGWVAVALVLIGGWAALHVTKSLADEDLRWRAAAEATLNPVPDAPSVVQYGPSVAVLAERTYTRTLTLPPDFVTRLGAQGIGVLSPYLSDPTDQKVLSLVDTFRRSGQDVVFTREVKKIDEDPLPAEFSRVGVRFRRLSRRAYDVEFEAHYLFANATDKPQTIRFVFPLPEAGTTRDLSVTVGGQVITEPGPGGAYEWKGEVAPGERREAVARYRAIGARSWRYDLGSNRRRVQRFQLDASTGGPVRFLRNSLHPAATHGNALRWDLANVVTAQQVALAFPPDVEADEAYLQALSALPASLVLFLAGVVVFGLRFRRSVRPFALASALAVFALGLGASSVLANYVGQTAGVLLAPLAGAALALGILGRRYLLAAVPAALLPAAFLSPRHSGLLIVLLALAVYAGAQLLRGRRVSDA